MPTSKNINNLVINQVENQEVYEYMQANGLVNDDELYLVEGENTSVLFVEQVLSDSQKAQARENIGVVSVAYGTCSTAAATAAKVITISGDESWDLKVGSIIVIKFSYTNTASNPTFNVNGTGAKSVWYNNALITTSSLSYAGYANRYCEYMYDGAQFVFLGWSVDSNTTYTPAKLGQGYGTCSTAAATVAKAVTLSSYALTTGGIVAVKFTYAVPAGATMNVNSKGAKAIYYRGAAITAGVIAAGDTATFVYNGSYYHLISVDKSIATTTANGWMSSTDKAKVDTLPETIADTTYTTARYRASSLHSTETTPTTNGVIAWMYE